MLESLQRTVLKYLYFKKHKISAPVDITTTCLLEEFQMERLETRRNFIRIAFLNDLIGGNIDDPALLSLLSFRVPYNRTRSTNNEPGFFLPLSKIMQQSPMYSAMKAWNLQRGLLPELDFTSRKSHLQQLLIRPAPIR